MVAFQTVYLENWRTRGYRFIMVLPREKYGVLRPLWSDKPLNKAFTIEMSEMKLLQMTDNYFLTLEKDVEPSRHLASR